MATKKILDYKDGKFVFDASNLPSPVENDLKFGNKALAVISVIGEHGSGKSFLQNVLLNYLQIRENSFIDGERIPDIFPLESNNQPETSGIDVYENYITSMPKSPGKPEHYVSVWDTEGSLDPHQDKEKIPAILGMAAYCSSVVIYNMTKNFNSNNMQNMQTLLNDLRASWKEALDKTFQDLVIVIRDWDDDRFTFGFEGGEDYKQHHLSKADGGQTTVFFWEIEKVFRSVRVFLMPQPNSHVTKRALNKNRKMSDMEEPFKSSLLRFCDVVANEVLEPRTIENQQLTVDNLTLYMMQYQREFKNKGEALNTMIESSVASSALKSCLEFYQGKCSSKILQFFKTADSRRKQHEESKELALSKARKELQRYSGAKTVETLLGQLRETIDRQYELTENSLTKAKTMVKNVLLCIGGVLIGSAAVALVVFVPVSRPIVSALLPKIVKHFYKALEGKESISSEQGVTTMFRRIPA